MIVATDYTADLERLTALASDPSALEEVLSRGLASLARIVPYDLAAVYELDGEDLFVRAAVGALASDRVRRNRLSLARFPALRRALAARRPMPLDEHDHARGLIAPLRGTNQRRPLSLAKFDEPAWTAIEGVDAYLAHPETVPDSRVHHFQRKRRDVDVAREEAFAEIEAGVLLGDAGRLSECAAAQQPLQAFVAVAHRKTIDFERVAISDPAVAFGGERQRKVRAKRP